MASHLIKINHTVLKSAKVHIAVVIIRVKVVTDVTVDVKFSSVVTAVMKVITDAFFS